MQTPRPFVGHSELVTDHLASGRGQSDHRHTTLMIRWGFRRVEVAPLRSPRLRPAGVKHDPRIVIIILANLTIKR